jgi:hypothetical protein
MCHQTEDRRQRTSDRGHQTEDRNRNRRQRTGDRGQKTENSCLQSGCVAGNLEKLRKMMKIAEIRKDSSGHFQVRAWTVVAHSYSRPSVVDPDPHGS